MVEKLINELGHKEFCIQLFMYEKGITRKKAIKLYDKFMEDDSYTSFLNGRLFGDEIDYY
ncbi:MAG: hypothetical protein RBR02_06260 [Desulfuromonadaceae bacterium]|nr:hypothetical protein [Desulfuromonadaceae bacterium]